MNKRIKPGDETKKENVGKRNMKTKKDKRIRKDKEKETKSIRKDKET